MSAAVRTHDAGSQRAAACDPMVDILLSGGQTRKAAGQCGAEGFGFEAALQGCRVVSAFPQGTVHEAPDDLQAAVRSRPEVFVRWASLTPLGRNEFICWVDDAKQATTRRRRIARTCDELLEGKKRPCCWAGCIHRTDKAPGRWQQAMLIDRKGKNGA